MILFTIYDLFTMDIYDGNGRKTPKYIQTKTKEKHHIGSGCNPDLGSKVQSRLLNFVLLVGFFSQNSYFLLLTLANGKISFSLPCLFNDQFELHPFLRSLLTAALFWYVRPSFFLP